MNVLARATSRDGPEGVRDRAGERFADHLQQVEFLCGISDDQPRTVDAAGWTLIVVGHALTACYVLALVMALIREDTAERASMTVVCLDSRTIGTCRCRRRARRRGERDVVSPHGRTGPRRPAVRGARRGEPGGSTSRVLTPSRR